MIVTDGTTGTAKMALDITRALGGNKVLTKDASDFMGNDILPADAFFLGCENSAPPSFLYLEDLLKHINLAGRTCGVFSSGSEKAAEYLAGILADCEAALNPRPFTASGAGIESWAKSVVAFSF